MTDLFEGGDHAPSARDELLAKWKDKPLEEVLAAKIESDLYIKTLEKQKDELRVDYLKQREELLAKAKFEELLDRMEKAPDKLASSDTTAKEESPKYNPKEVEDLIYKKIGESKINEEQVKNFNTVQNKLKERYGDSYQSVLKEQQTTLGLSSDDVNALAKKSPEAFFRLMQLDQPKGESFQSPPRSVQRNDQFSPRGEAKRTWAYYQDLKKTNPTLYLDRQTSIQMHEDHQKLGRDFEDGDFHRFG